MHYHAMGEAADTGSKKQRGPANGCCRCENHIAISLMATRERPVCEMECYLCERFRILANR